MYSPFGIDIEKSIEDSLDLQKKFVKGMENLLDVEVTDSDITPKDLVYSEDKMKLYHYKPLVKNPCKVPTLIVYALVNRQYMMDIQQDRSVIKNLLELGLDVYIMDWGYPTKEDMYLTMDDYINGYMNNAVEYIRKAEKIDQLNLLGVCQGGTFSAIYSSIYPEKIKNLVTMVTPIDFDTDDGLLFKWGKHLNIDNMVDTYGVLPGALMNSGYLLLKPFQLMLDKYVNLFENMDQRELVQNFMRMEKWIFDSPGQAGETLRQFVKDLYQENKLIKGTLEIGDKKVDLKNINMPVLNIYAQYDHLVPPSATIPLNDHISSTDKELCSFPVGHIGMYVSSKSQKQMSPKLAKWLMDRSK
ncbi:class III poly(R)-hydroxyalkanoic acid synthase subunit PhaC [Crassaminicella profunda]|uniref:class III poly(R)-hydroxyalkanoic acid synthase subunit PhaC n=1 Tax=Crassaminicella profunda TaxID=1286698 RepID=UPI001CA63021|nr:class III poly(R)-hydroxyalkanoic acid synthase subunit PhaC [Crassaminicella profunda]QZY55133.1 class III poly(R)-hydroxyalkanoic acid synthase subunit PhaC [Crassaminicella profunda]